MTPSPFDPIAWLQANLEWERTDSAAFLYERMASQSGYSLPVLYAPFDGGRRDHVIDRGQILDFAHALRVGGDERASSARILDFGPGDGWPALLIAPMAGEVVGVDGSPRRVAVCRTNAARLGIQNARFVHVPPGERLPFDDGVFDGVTAASSLEQTPDPRATLRELQRVLKPGGRLRMHYESLSFYRGGREREVDVIEDGEQAHVVIYDRRPDEEITRHYGLSIARGWQMPAYAGLTEEVVSDLARRATCVATWTTQHPSCATWLRWLAEAGFSAATPTHNGGWFAGRLFDELPESGRPRRVEEVDAMLSPLVKIVCEMPAPRTGRPGEWEPWITAVSSQGKTAGSRGG